MESGGKAALHHFWLIQCNSSDINPRTDKAASFLPPPPPSSHVLFPLLASCILPHPLPEDFFSCCSSLPCFLSPPPGAHMHKGAGKLLEIKMLAAPKHRPCREPESSGARRQRSGMSEKRVVLGASRGTACSPGSSRM